MFSFKPKISFESEKSRSSNPKSEILRIEIQNGAQIHLDDIREYSESKVRMLCSDDPKKAKELKGPESFDICSNPDLKLWNWIEVQIETEFGSHEFGLNFGVESRMKTLVYTT